MKSVFGFALGAVLVAASLFLVVRSRSIAHWLQVKMYPTESSSLPTLGLISDIKGQVLARPLSGADRPVRMNQGLTAGTQVVSRAESSFSIRFINGDDLEFGENAQIVIERWNRNIEKSPVFVSVLTGDWTLLQSDGRGLLYILQDGQLSTSTQKTVIAQAPLLVKPLFDETTAPPRSKLLPRSEPPSAVALGLSTDIGGSQTALPPVTMPAAPDTGVEAAAPEKTETPVTLENEYMDSVLAGQKSKLARCQANALRTNPQIKGQMLLGFRIGHDGKTQEARVLNTSVVDTGFQNCVLEVISTLKFRTFTGADIVRAFEVKFE